jgi:phage terminase small subunit
MKNSGLTPKQRQFVDEYLLDLNGTQSAIRAGYSKKNARIIAAQNLSKLNIQAVLREAMKKREQRTQVKADKVLKEAAKLAFSDIRQVFKLEDFELISPHELPDDVAPAVASVKKKVKVFRDKDGNTTEFVTWEYSFWDKNKALDKLFRHLGLYNDKLKLDADDELKALLKRIDGRGLPNPGAKPAA